MKEIIEKRIGAMIEDVDKSLPSAKEKRKAEESGDTDLIGDHWYSLGKISGLDEALRIVKAVSAWIPVSERLPKAFEIVLVWEKHAESPFVGWWDSKKNKWRANSDQFDVGGWDGELIDSTSTEDVSHWMPLPKQPKS